MKVFLVFLKRISRWSSQQKTADLFDSVCADWYALSLYRENHARFDGQYDARID